MIFNILELNILRVHQVGGLQGFARNKRVAARGLQVGETHDWRVEEDLPPEGGDPGCEVRVGWVSPLLALLVTASLQP